MEITAMMDVEMREGDEESFEDVEIDVVDIVVDILSELVDNLVDSNDDIFESNYGDVEEEEVARWRRCACRHSVRSPPHRARRAAGANHP